MWSQGTCITFERRTTQENYLLFGRGKGCEVLIVRKCPFSHLQLCLLSRTRQGDRRATNFRGCTLRTCEKGSVFVLEAFVYRLVSSLIWSVTHLASCMSINAPIDTVMCAWNGVYWSRNLLMRWWGEECTLLKFQIVFSLLDLTKTSASNKCLCQVYGVRTFRMITAQLCTSKRR